MSVARASKVKQLSDRAAAYGIPGVTVDGNDPQAVHDAVADAVHRARAGQGPSLVEAVTYRWKGHSKSDKNLYRTREEIETWREADPIARFEQACTLSEEDITACRTAARDAVREAVRVANAAPSADAASLTDAVYAP
jgi:TPP-dependent pyruvate/acetoin dehydrogenase alpha subunit